MPDLIILGVETGIAGGSLALIVNGSEIDSSVGNKEIARAEEVLPSIDQLLRINSISIRQLSGIVISTGPGSFTGVKSGIAMALGLRAATSTVLKGITAFKAIKYSSDNRNMIVAIPVGRGYIGTQSFYSDGSHSSPVLLSFSDFFDELKHMSVPVFCHNSLVKEIEAANYPFVKNAGENMAASVARAFNSPFADDALVPLYLDRTAIDRSK